jgi:peptidoglycan/LPS O-acetylase OafA/YrhL
VKGGAFARGRMPALDGVRGLAILMVMFHHFTIVQPASGAARALLSAAAMGRYGVDLFFVLSGCLITGILIDTRDDPHYFRTFYTRRILRIFPLYYALVAVTFLVVPAATRFLPADAAQTVNTFLTPSDWPWFAAFCSNFLIAIRDRYTNGLLDAAWSLAIEEHFYLVWPAVVLAVAGRGRLRSVCVAVLAVALVLRGAAWAAGWSRLQIYVVTFTRFDALAFGALVAIWMRGAAGEWSGHLRRAPALAAGLLATIVALWLTGQMDYTATVMNTIGYTLVGALGMQLVIQAVPVDKEGAVHRVFGSGAMRFFGKYSYGLYMFQLPVKGALMLLFFTEARMASSALFWQALFYVCAGTATIAAALVSWHLLEKNMLALKDRFAFTPASQPS